MATILSCLHVTAQSGNTPPVVNPFTFGPQANPGGNNRFPVPASTFTGSDAEDAPNGYPNNLRGRFIVFTNFTNGSFYYRGSTATQSVSAVSFDPDVVSFDPIDGNVTSSFQYRIFDNANQSSESVTVTIPFRTPITISGTVFNDGNGGTPDGRATGVIGNNTLFAVLLNGTTVVSRKAVDASNGTYSFGIADGVVSGNSYTLIITNGNTATTPSLAAGTAYVSESDGSVNGSITISNITGDVVNQNFGIDILPVVNAFTFGPQPNPGGNNRFPIPASTFTGSDAEDAPAGYLDNLRGRFVVFSGFSNGLLYYGGNTATQSIIIASFNPDILAFDPSQDGNVISSFQYTVRDNAGQTSPPATITIPFRTPVTISGTVFNDGNGGTPDGRATGVIGNNTLFAVLLNGTTVVSRKAVDANNGTYSFGFADGVVSGSTYNLIITNGNTATTPLLAAGTAYVSESDGSANGSITISNITANVVNQNFGIDILPTVFAATFPLQLNPGGNNRVPVPASTFTGSDPEDAPAGYLDNLRGRFVVFSGFSNGLLYYNGNTATQSIIVSSFSPDVLAFDPTDGTVTSSFQYTVRDNAGQTSPPATVTLPFRRGIPIAGNIWNDVNGNANKEATETAAIPNPLYVNIVNASGTVAQSLLVDAGGNYVSTPVFADSTYSVIITNTAQTTGAGLAAASMPPAAGWVYTGVNPGATTATANPGNRTGVLAVSTAGATDTIRNRNFGVERIPLAISSTLPPADIATPPVARTIPDTAFKGSDFDGGRLDSIRITAFPTNTQTLLIGGTSYTAASPQFTSGRGVGVTANAAGNPTQTIQVVPVASATAFSVTIPYVTVDNANQPSAAGATVVVPYTPVVLPTPFNCTPATSTYVIGFKNGTNCTVAPYNVYTMSMNGTLSPTPLFTTPDTIEVNGIGINAADSRGYALWFRRDNNSTPNSCINDTVKLIRFGANGNPQLLGYIPQPAGYILNTALGTMGTDGAYYYGALINGQLAVGRIANVAGLAGGMGALTATYRTVVNACGGRNFADWAFNPATPGVLYTYGIAANANNVAAGVVMTIDLNATTTNAVLTCVSGTETTGTFTNLAQDNLGGILFGSDGQLYGVNVNDRKYYRINPATGAIALVSTFPAGGSGGATSSPMRTDAASCVTIVPTPTPFDCTPSKATYVISYKNGTNCTVAPNNVYTMDLAGNVSPTPLFTTADTIEVNALGLSRLDGKGYGLIFRRDNNTTPGSCVNDTLKFFRFGANGVREILGYLIRPAGSPSLDLSSALGAMDANGNYYFATFANLQLYTAKIERTDTLTSLPNRSIPFTFRPVSASCFRNFSDWAINPLTNQLVSYGIYANSAGQVAGSLVQLDLFTNTLSCYGMENTTEFTNAGQDNMGGIMFGTDASMYAVNSYTRKFYKINPNTGALQYISTIPYGTTPTIRTDLASCVTTPSILPLGFEKPVVTSLGECRAELAWKVSGVEAGDVFIVEKSYDGLNFTTLTTLKATTAGASSYSITDGKTGITNYYRIKGISRNGDVKYSPVVKFLSSCGGKNNVTLYQNLLSAGSQVAGEISMYKTGVVTATIHSATGATLFTKTSTLTAGVSRFSYNLPALAKGVYLLQTIVGEERFTEKFIIQ